MPKMDEGQFKSFLQSEIKDAITFQDADIATRRQLAVDYIQLNMTDLPALPGRSSVVDATVGSQISLMMPGLMRIMTGGPSVVEYLAENPQDEKAAKEASDYVNNVVFKLDNEGERILHDWCYDGLSQILGTVKAYWEEEYDYKEETFENLSDDQFAQLIQGVEGDKSLEVTAYDKTSVLAQAPMIDPMSGQPVIDQQGMPVLMTQEVVSHTVTVKKTINLSKVRIENVPPEEFVISRARSCEEAVIRSHRTYKRAGELKDMGYKASVIDELPTYEDFTLDQGNKFNKSDSWNTANGETKDPDMRKIAVHQAIVRCNYDGKGIKEWYCVAAGSDSAIQVLEMEPYECQVVFADFCPQPLPHTVYGRCPADDLIPIQKVKTAVIRQTMDNLYKANTPQRIVATNMLQKGGLEALQNQVPGGLVLANSTEAVKDLAVPFFAQHSFPMLSYWDEEASKRSGVSMASMALDPDALQNQSATAANIMQTAAMSKVEMIARIWATGGMRKLFRGILKILKKYQDFPRNMKVSGQITQVNPQAWAELANWDVAINTGLGTGSREKDLAMLQLIVGKQEQVLQVGGPQNGIVTLGQLANGYRKLFESAGIQNVSQFIQDVPTDFTPPPPPPPQPTPDTLVNAKAITDVEQIKGQTTLAKAQVEIQSDERKALAKLQSDERIALAKIESEERIALQDNLVKRDANAITAARTALEAEARSKEPQAA